MREKNDNEGQQKPSTKMTKNCRGQIRQYYYLETVKSMDELDKLRFKNHCSFVCGKRFYLNKNKKSFSIPCTRKRFGKTCDFELMALRPNLGSGTLHVYAHSQHNHTFEPEDKRLTHKREKTLMLHDNPQMILRTPDQIEFKYLQTFSDYEQMQNQFKNECHCQPRGGRKRCRFRLPCYRKLSHNCKFQLLAIKTTKRGYHVYTHGAHKHNNPPADIKSKTKTRTKKQESAKGQQKVNRRKEVEQEEEEEEKEEEDDDDEEIEEFKGVEKVEKVEEDGCDDVIVIEDEEQPEAKGDEGSMKVEIIEQNVLPNSREEELKEKLAKANEKVYKWMAGIETNEIEGTIGDWDKLSLLKMVEMADQEIREHPDKLNLWLPWLKCAIHKCLPQIDGFNVRFKDLIRLSNDNDNT